MDDPNWETELGLGHHGTIIIEKSSNGETPILNLHTTQAVASGPFGKTTLMSTVIERT